MEPLLFTASLCVLAVSHNSIVDASSQNAFHVSKTMY